MPAPSSAATRLSQLSSQIMSAPARPPVTCHILDTTVGRPAANVKCTLLAFPTTNAPAIASEVAVLATGLTNADGRVTAWETAGVPLKLQPGAAYKMRFEVEEYFTRTGQETFFPYVEIAFRVRSTDEHYHVPLLLAGWSYSTYRGS